MQHGEYCQYDNACADGDRCFAVYFDQNDNDWMQPLEGREHLRPNIDSDHVRREVCYHNNTAAVGEPCERGADCQTDACNLSTRTCQYACIVGIEEDSYPTRNICVFNIGEQEWRCNGIVDGQCSDDQTCGPSLKSRDGSCQPKFEVSCTTN